MTATEVQAVTDHPAKFSKTVLAEMAEWLQREADLERRTLSVLDPFAGVGLVHNLGTTWGVHTVGVEIEPEWAACHQRTVVGDVFELPAMLQAGKLTRYAGGVPLQFDVIATSPCYGNRMSDSHQAADLAKCPTCRGRGLHPDDGEPCITCAGTGRSAELSRRNTYTHRLRAATGDPTRTLEPTNAGTIPWGPRYRQFHERAYRSMLQVLRPGGLVMVNISNHLETAKGITVEHRVAEWTLNCWLTLGAYLVAVPRIETPRNRQGANYDVRVDGELLLVLRAPDAPPQLF